MFLSVPTHARSTRTIRPNSEPRCRYLQVLLVEDNPGDVRLVREAFDQSDVDSSLTVCTDGEDALDYLFQQNEHESEPPPELIVLDLNVPKVNGRKVLQATTSDPELESIPVIVFSGSKAEEDIVETYRSGADGYLVKPTDPNEFISTVQTIAEALANSEPPPAGEFSRIDLEE